MKPRHQLVCELALCSLILPLTITAQEPRDIVPLKYWSAPLYWQPSPAERSSSTKLLAAFSAPTSPATLMFVAMTPCRVIDTRSAFTFPAPFGAPSLVGGATRSFPMQASTLCSIPSTALAYSLNVTVTPAGGVGLGFLTLWPAGSSRPNASTINNANFLPALANAAIVPAGNDTSGSIDAYASNATDLIIDINGYFVSSPSGSSLTLPFTGTYNGGAASAFSIADNVAGPATDPTLAFAAIAGDGGYNTGPNGFSAGNVGVKGLGGAGGTSFSPAVGGIGLLGFGGAGGEQLSGSGLGAQGGTGVYAIGGGSGPGFFGETGGVGVQAYGGFGATACINNPMTGEACYMNLPTGGGNGGAGIITHGGTGGPGGAGGVGIFAFAGTPGSGGTNSNIAGFFTGNVSVTGTLTKGAGSFRIDHPQDPANKYLSHSFVESPDMMNIYDGTIILDDSGAAWVELPGWFEALNRDFRYQLTPIGKPAPGLFIAEEVSNNRFKIAGGPSRVKVSWTVTGIRQDAYANAHRIPVEEEKSKQEKGSYLHPELYGMPDEKNVVYAQHPELLPSRSVSSPIVASRSGSDGSD